MATEKRLIDTHDLWSDIMMLPHNGDMISSEEVEQAITEAPTVDAVEVVRCKDCKHFWHYKRTQMHVDGKSVPAGMCHLWSKIDSEHPVLLDDFCSHGKKGENCITKHPELLLNRHERKKK